MRLLAIDPGSEITAWVLFDDGRIHDRDFTENHAMAMSLFQVSHVAVEYMRPRGMPTSKEEMDTQFWAGRFIQEHAARKLIPWTPIYRHDVKLHLCGNARAKDPNIRQALIDRYGGESVAIGNKKCRKCKGKGTYKRETCSECEGSKWLHPPGPLAGIHDDLWSALAIGVTWLDTNSSTETSPAGNGEM